MSAAAITSSPKMSRVIFAKQANCAEQQQVNNGVVVSAQRAREAELIFVGNEFRRAIALFYYRTPGPAHEHPGSLDELLEDPRYPGTQRYLRRIYRDPVTGKAEWGLIMGPGGRIMGVHSLSDRQPIKSGNFSAVNREFADKSSYREWQFRFVP